MNFPREFFSLLLAQDVREQGGAKKLKTSLKQYTFVLQSVCNNSNANKIKVEGRHTCQDQNRSRWIRLKVTKNILYGTHIPYRETTKWVSNYKIPIWVLLIGTYRNAK